MQIKNVKLSVLKKHPKNARVHDAANIRAIADSLVNFGQRTPLVLNRKNQILKGNGTFDAMVLLGWVTCQITTAFNLTPDEELAYLIADNKTGDMSEFDFELASNILKDLDKRGFDLTKTGFRDFESQPLLEANFNPGTPGEMPTDTNVKNGGIVLTYTKEPAELIINAVEFARKHLEGEDIENMSDADIVLCMVTAWQVLARAKVSSNVRRRK